MSKILQFPQPEYKRDGDGFKEAVGLVLLIMFGLKGLEMIAKAWGLLP